MQALFKDLLVDLKPLAQNDLSSFRKNGAQTQDGSLQRAFQPSLQLRFTSYQRVLGQKTNKALLASKRVEEVSSILKESVQQATMNYEDIETKLLPASQEIKVFAKKVEVEAAQIEKETKKAHFWSCSGKCIALGVIVGVLVAGAVGFVVWKYVA